MNRLLGLIGMTLGGWVGWTLGAHVSFFVAFILGMIGTGAGLYVTQRWARRYLP